MNEELLNLEPKRIWHYFREILEIPRPSKKEEKIAEYLLNFGKRLNMETLRDETGNILIRKKASVGNENRKMVCLQSHIDMVGEKNSDKQFDFEKDPIQAYIDGDWVKAKGTTLGADDGIGIAAQLAILESDEIEHGPLECLFTVDEETGLTGAFGLDPVFLKSDILLNLDSEDEGELFIGCAGGKDTTIELPFLSDPVPTDLVAYKVNISGLVGGHSGDDIHKGRGNAVKLMNRLLWNAANDYGIRIARFEGGKLRNAIAREAEALVTVPKNSSYEFTQYVSRFEKIIKKEYKITEPNLKLGHSDTKMPKTLIDKTTQKNLLNALYACPHGVIAWSQEIPDFVQTSTNLAAVEMCDETFFITTSQRSSVESEKIDIADRVEANFRLTGAKVNQGNGYPGWSPNPDSDIVRITEESYKKLFDQQPKVLAIHAGLECGLIGDKYPKMDMISFGPTIKGAHSPDERLDIETVQKFWNLTLDVLKKIPKK
ncbi:MAG: aminoacyl-histidine dipeptidase [Bacteroidales bacterium]|nr:aminoacyl-histidine dipeptidase [Bacteroidales bacterium]MCF8343272.1 aminoacyl-histidine dipeptidase [Bacteroidales bacterium]MCF8350844.1 aminoacyl-histidine dipeptidase [Bacteroidales bacterium]MCF8375741.1 aminoacyl-histidine dipeptidase [Bacteroidales bacterium]MCF8400341.1 aminoacyl-histidine dipeptidase [Bacteroidales bacterium]